MTAHRTRVFSSAMVVSALLLVASTPVRAEEWQVTITPYVWASNLGMKVTAGSGGTVVDHTIGFGDLVKNLDMTAQVAIARVSR